MALSEGGLVRVEKKSDKYTQLILSFVLLIFYLKAHERRFPF
jgi:hypothetical protein